PAAYAIGVAAALAVPLWLRGKTSRLADLIRTPGPLGGRGGGPGEAPPGPGGSRCGDPADALRPAHRTLRVLARTRLPWWRNTCLYRALAECLVLRRYGIPCRVELGVTRAPLAEDRGEIGAPAWVVREDAEAQVSHASMTVLR